MERQSEGRERSEVGTDQKTHTLSVISKLALAEISWFTISRLPCLAASIRAVVSL